MKLGVCYYPEHWPKARWVQDAQQMREIGIEYVRVGEFSWSRLEPAPGELDWSWLDESLAVLHQHGLKVVLGTPTPTPPKWLVDQHPDMLAKDENGNVRGFGSRRHYTFASTSYRTEVDRIVTLMAQRYGEHPAVYAWQTDNEYGCHDTILSYADADLIAFRIWLKEKYGSISELNTAWGNVFWSMEYRSFDEIELPNLTVTEANPIHRLDFQRCCSDQVVAYNKLQTEILRKFSPDRDLIHNYMGFFTAFDHYKVGNDLDIASWDTYPLGFLDQEDIYRDDEKQRYMRTGHPDFGAFHHDLYRACGKGRLWIMEQQPGPVNWAPHNPAPANGAVRLWTWEAFSHGAEVVSYFRWRQAPFAQEQMHAGLLRTDGEYAEAAFEAKQVSSDVEQLAHQLDLSVDDLMALPSKGQVALVFDYDSCWTFDIQPQSNAYRYMSWFYRCYEAIRKLGLSIDIVSPQSEFEGYEMLVLPAQANIDQEMLLRLQAFEGRILFGPRSGSKTSDYRIPDNLAPGKVQALVDVVVERVDALPKHTQLNVYGSWGRGAIQNWHEQLKAEPKERPQEVLLKTDNGTPVLVKQLNSYYLGSCVDDGLLEQIFSRLAQSSGLTTNFLPEGIRVRDRGPIRFAFNYGNETREITFSGYEKLLGSNALGQCDLSIWRATS
ncbi:beta-galactosidase [Marinomonas balearica]|uniref:Beta-galactosidase n=1 Tax=Marinomonas balearica TaxID=491947 RepID=A0A4R6M3F3_9GAMM|nr:beta-galactosidase [Marinomonas balearica]TDO95818.1 beta-galactosidase [Marinomonas balearica]